MHNNCAVYPVKLHALHAVKICTNIGPDQESSNEPHHEKNNVLVSDPVQHKPGCTATEDG